MTNHERFVRTRKSRMLALKARTRKENRQRRAIVAKAAETKRKQA
jgi:hypothetical protein